MLYLMPNQQRQSTEGNNNEDKTKNYIKQKQQYTPLGGTKLPDNHKSQHCHAS